MNKNYYKNMASWFFFTFLLGTLPIVFLMLATWIKKEPINLQSMSKEIFFLTVILCADTLKSLYCLEDKSIGGFKVILYGISVFLLVVSSSLFGIMLIVEEKYINKDVYFVSALLCSASAVCGVVSQAQINHSVKISRNE